MRGSLFINRIQRDDRGATSIEYGLIVALIALAIMTALKGVANETTGMWAYVRNNVTTHM